MPRVVVCARSLFHTAILGSTISSILIWMQWSQQIYKSNMDFKSDINVDVYIF